jgi:hypothetical protein
MKHLGDPAVRGRILERIAALKPGKPALWGQMNAHQMLCHLGDSFRVPMGRKCASPATGLLQRTAMKWGALYLPVPWAKGFPTRPEVEQGAGGTPPSCFQYDRADLIALIEQFSHPGRPFTWHPHPVFGPMDERQWLRWGYLHSDHHLRQFGL